MPFYILTGATLMTALTVPPRLIEPQHRAVVYLVSATLLTLLALWVAAPQAMEAWATQQG